ncbi:hypothetical protein G5V58_15315 [Nocardioides anomalus]|uniref:Uncharacterized protein n=1 Tax=Nocardioides anomalus TaxID=2712223 RepID=A0A6G6WF47_9ACTN|nr:hypothetical protein [Nocardioides anomalus]QIG43958.1 hypothetical protein G5V58_15315 [Nocardioides anomalus]
MLKTALSASLAGAALTTALTAGLVTTPAHAAPIASGDDPTACQRVWDRLQEAMQDDIAAAVSLPPRAQRRALVAVRTAALHGVYGEQVQQAAERLRARRAEVYRSFPAALKADVRAARSLGPREQRRAMTAIRTAARRGVYGDRVQALAEKRQAFYAGCDGVAQTAASATGDPLAG